MTRNMSLKSLSQICRIQKVDKIGFPIFNFERLREMKVVVVVGRDSLVAVTQ